MNSVVRAELMLLKRNGSEFVFTVARTSEKLNCVRTAFTPACKRAEPEDLRFHDLRHTFATNLVMRGVDLVTVKDILGHSDITMTVRYSHPSDSRKMEAVEKLVPKRKVEVYPQVVKKYGHNMVTIAENDQNEEFVSH